MFVFFALTEEMFNSQVIEKPIVKQFSMFLYSSIQNIKIKNKDQSENLSFKDIDLILNCKRGDICTNFELKIFNNELFQQMIIEKIKEEEKPVGIKYNGNLEEDIKLELIEFENVDVIKKSIQEFFKQFKILLSKKRKEVYESYKKAENKIAFIQENKQLINNLITVIEKELYFCNFQKIIEKNFLVDINQMLDEYYNNTSTKQIIQTMVLVGISGFIGLACIFGGLFGMKNK
jgi:hypothetical protein